MPATASAPAGSTTTRTVLEDVLDRRADLVGADEDDLVDDLAREAERLLADAPHGDAVGERADAVERDELPARSDSYMLADSSGSTPMILMPG